MRWIMKQQECTSETGQHKMRVYDTQALVLVWLHYYCHLQHVQNPWVSQYQTLSKVCRWLRARVVYQFPLEHTSRLPHSHTSLGMHITTHVWKQDEIGVNFMLQCPLEHVPFTCETLEHALNPTAYECCLNIIQPALLLPPFHTEKNDENCGLMVQRGAPTHEEAEGEEEEWRGSHQEGQEAPSNARNHASSGMPLIDSIGRVLSTYDGNAIISRGSPKSPHSWHPLHHHRTPSASATHVRRPNPNQHE